MLRFFRRTRLDSIAYNNTRSYILYAIGEILLVVIGILLALRINNWNEDSKKHVEEIKVLQNFDRDLQNDLEQLEIHIGFTSEKMLLIDSLFQLLNNPDQASLQKLMAYNLEIPFVDYFIENRGTYDEGVSSGKISFIKTDSLREQIFEYYRFVQQSRTDAIQVKFVEDILLPQWGEIVIPTREGMQHLGFESRLPPIDIEALSTNQKYVQLIAQKFGTNQVQIENWNRITKRATKLKRAVRLELSKCNK